MWQLMFGKFEYDGKLNPTFAEGPFQLPISCIRAYMKEPMTPRFGSVYFLNNNQVSLEKSWEIVTKLLKSR